MRSCGSSSKTADRSRSEVTSEDAHCSSGAAGAATSLRTAWHQSKAGAATSGFSTSRKVPTRAFVRLAALDQHIAVRIPGGQPIKPNGSSQLNKTPRTGRETALRLCHQIPRSPSISLRDFSTTEKSGDPLSGFRGKCRVTQVRRSFREQPAGQLLPSGPLQPTQPRFLGVP
jgi:hypothetical protein